MPEQPASPEPAGNGPLSRRDAERAEEARLALEAVKRDSHLLGGSAMARAAEHFSAGDAPPGDAIEIWGRRIGRVLSLIFAVYLVGWLFDWFTR